MFHHKNKKNKNENIEEGKIKNKPEESNGIDGKREKNSSPFYSESNIQDGAEIHTMQDDLDKADNKKIVKKENKQQLSHEKSPFMDNKQKEEHNKKESKNSLNKDFLNKKNNISSKRESNFIISSEGKDDQKSEKSKTKKDLDKSNKNKSIAKNNKNRLLIITSGVLLVTLIFLGTGYYWFVTRNNKEEEKIIVENKNEDENSTVKEINNEIDETLYSKNGINYLEVNTEKDTYDDIMEKVKSISGKISQENKSSIYEFKIKDKKGYQLAFSRFAYLFKLSFPEGILNKFNEKFSLFFYNDNGNIRLAVAIENNGDPNEIKEILKQNESVLANAISPLFLENKITKPKTIFSNGNYKDFNIRYVNLNQENTLSMDYSIVGNYVVIGTSKNSTRKIIDEVLNSEEYIKDSSNGNNTIEEKENAIEDDIAEDDIAEDDIAEDDIAEDDIAEDDIAEDDIAEDDIAEDDIAEDDIE